MEAVGHVFTNYENEKNIFSLKVTSGGSHSGSGASFSGEDERAAPYRSKAPDSLSEILRNVNKKIHLISKEDLQ
ncbi:hypothetical protein SRABI80_04319 [Peribacillus frigoritolerans]|uniref:hypothetical protein n=1 Tax=Peribacillus frigoritolerans TaxID=450367 RepID=UPI001D735FBC|nr:hypothetical protein [Peribacillus frigoritolerans]CAH0303646.1 hypothetical protein SRABI80_04319 [Peribacillus frigoritolerans]